LRLRSNSIAGPYKGKRWEETLLKIMNGSKGRQKGRDISAQGREEKIGFLKGPSICV